MASYQVLLLACNSVQPIDLTSRQLPFLYENCSVLNILPLFDDNKRGAGREKYQDSTVRESDGTGPTRLLP